MSLFIFSMSSGRPSFAATEVKISGDMRLRYQKEALGEVTPRPVARLQARLGFAAELSEQLKLQMRLMTGNDAGSGNQTLGDRASLPSTRRSFALDHAFFDYAPIEEIHLYGGRQPTRFQFAGKNQMLLDRDLALEGFSSAMQSDIDRNRFSLNLGGYLLREQYDETLNAEESDNMLYGAQFVYRLGFPEMQVAEIDLSNWSFQLGYGVYGFTGLKEVVTGNAPAFPSRGNSTDVLNGSRYQYNFDIQQLLFELKGKIGTVDLTLFYESLKNTSADALNAAGVTGLQLSMKPVSISFATQKVEKDAVVGLFADSDFAGGFTSSSGSIWSLAWALSSYSTLTYSEFNNQVGIETSNSTGYKRSHLDLQFMF